MRAKVLSTAFKRLACPGSDSKAASSASALGVSRSRNCTLLNLDVRVLREALRLRQLSLGSFLEPLPNRGQRLFVLVKPCFGGRDGHERVKQNLPRRVLVDAISGPGVAHLLQDDALLRVGLDLGDFPERPVPDDALCSHTFTVTESGNLSIVGIFYFVSTDSDAD